MLNNFYPKIGEKYEIISAQNVFGVFSQVEFPKLCDSKFQIVYTSDKVFVEVVPDNSNNITIKTKENIALSLNSNGKLKLNNNEFVLESSSPCGIRNVSIDKKRFSCSDVYFNGNFQKVITKATDQSNKTKSDSTNLSILTNVFEEQYDPDIVNILGGSVFLKDMDNDGYLDLIGLGQNSNYRGSIKIYQNDGYGKFIDKPNSGLYSLKFGQMEIGDFNKDSLLDIIMIGRDSSDLNSTKLFLNNGNFTFNLISNSGIPNYQNARIAIGDIDNDGFNDILISARDNMQKYTKLFINNKNNTFSELLNSNFINVDDGDVSFVDYDNDNDLDIFLTGWDFNGKIFTKLYRNDGSLVFTEVLYHNIPNFTYNKVDWVDYDNNGYLDLLISGGHSDSGLSPNIFKNNGNSTFSPQNIKLKEGYYGSVKWIDFDNDNDFDIIISGQTQWEKFTKFYINNGNNDFTEYSGFNFLGLNYSDISIGDIDNDNDLDFVMIGSGFNEIPRTIIYKNKNLCPCNQNGSFSSSTINVNACESYTLPSGDETYFESGSLTDVLKNYWNCDSILNINLNIKNKTSGQISVNTCNQYTSPSGKRIFKSSGTYFDTLVNNLGCDSILQINLTLRPQSVKNISVQACRTYTSPSGKYIYTQTGNYNDTLTNYLGCDSVFKINLQVVKINRQLTITNNRLKSAEVNAIFQWLDCNDNYSPILGETFQYFTPNVNGTYAVEIIRNDCKDTSICLTVNNVNVENIKKNPLVVYPNPAHQTLNIEVIDKGKLEIFNIEGQLVKEIYIENETYTLLIENYSFGVYFIKFTNLEGQIYSIKFLKE